MRIADLLGRYRERVRRVVDFDPMGLRLFRYIADLPTIDPSEANDRLPPDTLVLTTIRCLPQFDEDLGALESRLRHAERGTIVLACLEPDFEFTPVPSLADACDRNGWRIERIVDLSATRLRTGVLMEVRSPSGSGADAELLRMRNALVLADHERRRLRRRLDEVLRDGPTVVTVDRPASSEDGSGRARLRKLQEIENLKAEMQRLTRERDQAKQRREAIANELDQIRGSASYLIGHAVVQGRHRPQYLLRLPLDLRNLVRQRRARQRSSNPSSPPGSTKVTARPSAPTGTPSLPDRRHSAPWPSDIARIRIATIARRSLVERLRSAADVLPLVVGSWLGPAHDQLAIADVLLVDASVGSVASNWRGLGDPGEVARTSQLIDLLDVASAIGLPSVLLVRDDQIPPGLRPIQDRFSVTLPWTLGRAGWDPGIALNQLPWPAKYARDSSPIYITDSGRQWHDLDAADQWLNKLKPRGLQRWLVGTEAIVDAGPGSGLKTVFVPAAPLAALAQRSVVVVPSAGDEFYGTAALAAGCRVLARVPVADWNEESGLIVMPHPDRARVVLNAEPAPPTPAQVLAVRRQLLTHGSSLERAVSLAELLGLPLAGSLRRASGLSMVAHVRDRRAGEILARGVLAQEVMPRDMVVATGEPSDAPWLNEMRASGLRVALRRTDALSSQLAAAARQSLVAIWNEDVEIGPTDLATLELAHMGIDAPAEAYPRGLTLVDRLTMLSSMQPVGNGLPAKGWGESE